MSIRREAYAAVAVLLALGGLAAWHGGSITAAWFGVGLLTASGLGVWLEHRS